jgi:hypothetical protein
MRSNDSGDRPKVTGGWRWARLQLVGIEEQEDCVLVDVLQLDGDAVEHGGVDRGLPATVSFGPSSQNGEVTERIDRWLHSDVPVMDCFASVLPPGPTVVLVHEEEYLVLDGVASG